MSNLTQITDKIFCIELQSHAKSISISKNSINQHFLSYADDIIHVIDLDSLYQILGTVDLESISFDCEGYVKSFNSDLGKVYDSYTNKDKFWACPKLYFRSLLKSKGIEPTSESKILIIEKQ
jgi:hypothetical protein